MADISRVTVREGLKPRREPYWRTLQEGRAIGYRRMSTATPGAWLARFYDPEAGKYHLKSLGDLAQMPDKDRWPEAKKQAEEWFAHLDIGGATKAGTVKEACAAYVEHQRERKGEAAAKDAEGTFKRLVYGDPIARIDLSKLRPDHFTAWAKRIRKVGADTYFNRNLTPLRAAMHLALDAGKVASSFAWAKALKPLKLDAGEGRREIYLTPEQRHLLIEKASAELKPLVTSWALLPVRPGEIAQIKVANLNVRDRTITIPAGKTGARTIPLTAQALAHFRECAQGKLPGAWLVSRAGGGQWDRFAWRDEMQAAVEAAKLPAGTVAYTIRHSTITDLVNGGLDLMTVAKIAGTSIAMIDKFYGKLLQDRARAALEQFTVKGV